jgi:DNA polymerase III gamma/tau subunit
MSNIAQSAWFEKHRPLTIQDVVFTNEEHKNLANQWITNEKIDGNILLTGAAGTGKTTLSQILIKTIKKDKR